MNILLPSPLLSSPFLSYLQTLLEPIPQHAHVTLFQPVYMQLFVAWRYECHYARSSTIHFYCTINIRIIDIKMYIFIKNLKICSKRSTIEWKALSVLKWCKFLVLKIGQVLRKIWIIIYIVCSPAHPPYLSRIYSNNANIYFSCWQKRTTLLSTNKKLRLTYWAKISVTFLVVLPTTVAPRSEQKGRKKKQFSRIKFN